MPAGEIRLFFQRFSRYIMGARSDSDRGHSDNTKIKGIDNERRRRSLHIF